MLTLLACTTPDPPPDAAARSDADPIVAVTFNTGSSGGYDPAYSGDFGSDQAEALDVYYGNGLAWSALIAETRSWFDAVAPDVVALQEIFWPGDCGEIPEEDWPGFICEGWQPGDPSAAELALGPAYQIACNLDHPDKCLAVHTDFGSFRGCSGPICLDGLDGAEVDTCGDGARIGRGTIDRADGSTLTVVGVHGSSGMSGEEQGCRVQQFAQVFEDLDGRPAANGETNLILGDFNTDPGRWTEIDPSAAYLVDHVDGSPFHFVTEVGPEAEPTYLLANIDHVISDVLSGSCWHAGLGEDPAVSQMGIFDHRPAVCSLSVQP